MKARFAIGLTCLAVLTTACENKRRAAMPPRPIPRPKPAAPSGPTPGPHPTGCASALRTLAPDVDGRDGRVVLVLFWARWSAPDKLLIKALEPEIARDADRWRLIKSDIDEQPDAAMACDIRSVPTLLAVANGKPVSQIVGAVPAARLRKFLEAIPTAPVDRRD